MVPKKSQEVDVIATLKWNFNLNLILIFKVYKIYSKKLKFITIENK